MSAANTWAEIRATAAPDTGWHGRRVDSLPGVPLLYAVRQPGGIPALLVEMSAAAVPPIAEYPTAEGFRVAPEPITPGPRGRIRLCLMLTDDRYQDVFAVLVDDIVSSIHERTSEDNVIRALLARLHVWQVFMRRHGPNELGPEQQTGLVAELMFLRDWPMRLLTSQSAVEAWTGPDGAPQDFSFANVAVEIKATLAASPAELLISSIEQLDSSASSVPIVLCCTKVTLLPAGGKTLPELVDEIRERLSREDPAAHSVFEDRLLAAGYVQAHCDRYAARRYSQPSMEFYRVDGDFPRIERTDLRSGVVSCSYSIRLLDAAPFRIVESELERAVRTVLQ
jgi:hypothetical protein